MDEPIILTIISKVLCSTEGAEPPEVAVIKLTQKDLDRYRSLSESVKALGVYMIEDYVSTAWYSSIPLLNFEDVGKCLFVGFDFQYDYGGSDDLHYHKTVGEDPDETNAFERIDTELLCVRERDFYFRAYQKYSGNKIEATCVSFGQIEEALKAEPMPKASYFFPTGEEDYPKSLEEAPKYVNANDHVVLHYTKALLRTGLL